MTTGSGSGGQKQKMGDKNKGKGQVGMVEQGGSSEDAAFVLVEKKKLDGLQKKGKSVQEVAPATEKEEPGQTTKDLRVMWEGRPFF